MKGLFCAGSGKRFFAVLGLMGFLAGGGVRYAEGDISLVVTPVTIDPGLAAAGWEGIKVSLMADAKSESVVGVDLKNRVSANTSYYWNDLMAYTQDVDSIIGAGEAIGISGPVYQTWNEEGDGSDGATPTGKLGKKGGGTDSFFLNSDRYLEMDDFTEDNLDAMDNGEGKMEGVGSLMTFSGAVPWQKQVATLDIAFLIVPEGKGDVYFRGTVTDAYDYEYGFNEVLNPGDVAAGEGFAIRAALVTTSIDTVPEVGTVGIGVVMAGAVLVRRRRAAGR